MGPVLVATMVQGAVAEPSKKLHPFFVKGPSTDPSTPSADTIASHDDLTPEPGDAEVDGRKRRKTDSSLPQETLEPKKRQKRNGGASLDGSILNHLSKPECVATPPIEQNAELLVSIQASSTVEPSDPVQPAPLTQPEPTPAVPAKATKVLKFNPKTGTLGSPPKPKQKTPVSRIVSIKYGRDDENRKEISDKITRILDGSWQVPITPTKKRASRGTRRPKDAAPMDASSKTHPFFTGKSKQTAEPAKAVEAPKPTRPRNSIFMSTPGSPRKPRAQFTSNKLPHFGMQSMGTKVPGAMFPLWPALGMSHVRGETFIQGLKSTPVNRPTPRKFKGQVVAVAREESILHCLAHRLDLRRVRDTLPRDENAFDPAPAELRLPERHFESGRRLQRRVRSHLRTYRESESSQDELSEQPSKVHAAIKRFYDSLETHLSAYDRSTCETLAWTHKYAPVTASQILQAGKEGSLLRQWLEALKVQSVDTGDGSKGKGKPEVKEKRKKNKLDGFVVDSDEEANEMDEVSEDEADWAPGGPGRLNKTVVRSGDVSKGRLTNAVVLSGPHGSGKTAAVYAVAKELGFEVFEINSSSRRSGRDILEKVGDMTRNHLVQQHRAEEGAGATEDEVDKDIRSGKQGVMMTFFKPKTGERKPKIQKEPDEEAKSAAPKAQKQSLILLEEVDILYDEDKQFWATLMSLIVQSKRPFIMTCNDETLVPLQSLSLHGIFRFSPPPTDLAVDLCLLIAANEGHALRRDAVDALYDARGNDLRATITDLNYWCQLGIGDRRGGFDWFYLRWPKGSDLDEDGDVVRVISENTYGKGMGWIGRDLIVTTPNQLHMEEEAMRQSWDSWQLDVGDWQESIGMESWAQSMSDKAILPTLAAYDEFCGSMSDADLCSSGGFAAALQEHIDSTLPDMPAKARDDFIIGRTLLDASPLVRQVSSNVDISISLKSLARSDLLSFTSRAEGNSATLRCVDEDKAVAILDASFGRDPYQMTRHDLALAFDPIAVSDKAIGGTLLDPSVFDRTLKLIIADVAPWVRGIVQYDHRLMQERLKLSSLLSEGGGKRKRMRTTRSAYSALEGGERRTTRRERYFGDKLVTGFVMRTAGERWLDAVDAEGAGQGGGEVASLGSDDELSV